MRTEMGGLGY